MSDLPPSLPLSKQHLSILVTGQVEALRPALRRFLLVSLTSVLKPSLSLNNSPRRCVSLTSVLNSPSPSELEHNPLLLYSWLVTLLVAPPLESTSDITRISSASATGSRPRASHSDTLRRLVEARGYWGAAPCPDRLTHPLRHFLQP